MTDKSNNKKVDNKLTKDRWILSLDETHSRVIVKCLKFYAQMSIGRFFVITEILPPRKKYNKSITFTLVNLRNKLFPELRSNLIPKNKSDWKPLPLFSKSIPETTKTGFHVYKKIIDKTPPMKITITENEGYAINSCLEFYFRMAMGQFDFVFDNIFTIEKWLSLNFDRNDSDLIDLWFKMFPELQSLNSYHGIHSSKIPKEAQIACEIYSVIRHRLSWDRAGNPPKRDWKTMMGVNFDEPMNISGHPFCKIEKVKNGKK